MAQISQRSVLSGISGRPIPYEVGQASALRQTITNRKVGSAISPTPQQKKPIPVSSRKAGGRTF